MEPTIKGEKKNKQKMSNSDKSYKRKPKRDKK